MEIEIAMIQDAEEILALQKLAYRSEAEIYEDYSIAPLIQTLEETNEIVSTADGRTRRYVRAVRCSE